MCWIYFYIIPLLIDLIAIYILFREYVSKYDNPKEKRNLYELFKQYGFFIWVSIFPIANILPIIVVIMLSILDLVQSSIEKILKKIKI